MHDYRFYEPCRCGHPPHRCHCIEEEEEGESRYGSHILATTPAPKPDTASEQDSVPRLFQNHRILSMTSSNPDLSSGDYSYSSGDQGSYDSEDDASDDMDPDERGVRLSDFDDDDADLEFSVPHLDRHGEEANLQDSEGQLYQSIDTFSTIEENPHHLCSEQPAFPDPQLLEVERLLLNLLSLIHAQYRGRHQHRSPAAGPEMLSPLQISEMISSVQALPGSAMQSWSAQSLDSLVSQISSAVSSLYENPPLHPSTNNSALLNGVGAMFSSETIESSTYPMESQNIQPYVVSRTPSSDRRNKRRRER